MIKNLGLAFLALLVLEGPAFATGPSAPTQLGTATGTTTAVITTGVAAPAGSLIVVMIALNTSLATVTSVVDSAGNCSGAYTALDNTGISGKPTPATFYCPNIGSQLNSGGTITVTVPSTDPVAVTAFYASGMAASPADIHAKQTNVAGSNFSTSTGTLGQAAELVVGMVATDRNSGTINVPTGYAAIGSVLSSSASVYAEYSLTCSTNSSTYNPSWQTASQASGNVVSFKTATTGNSICATKESTNVVLAPSVEQASKLDGYVVLSTTTMQDSKSDAYIVLAPGTAPSALFHSFPP